MRSYCSKHIAAACATHGLRVRKCGDPFSWRALAILARTATRTVPLMQRQGSVSSSFKKWSPRITGGPA